jgi:hypothetical protein
MATKLELCAKIQLVEYLVPHFDLIKPIQIILADLYKYKRFYIRNNTTGIKFSYLHKLNLDENKEFSYAIIRVHNNYEWIYLNYFHPWFYYLGPTKYKYVNIEGDYELLTDQEQIAFYESKHEIAMGQRDDHKVQWLIYRNPIIELIMF